jgi:hypothetical protein
MAARLRRRLVGTRERWRHPPNGTFVLEIVATQVSGPKLHAQRTGDTCVPKLPGHKQPFL